MRIYYRLHNTLIVEYRQTFEVIVNIKIVNIVMIYYHNNGNAVLNLVQNNCIYLFEIHYNFKSTKQRTGLGVI